ncbi:hypothetical protein SMB34_13445 [Thalassospira permensis NBRC 106175]|uniref:Uncharacterized protein n=1 Tax=Thalassospira permensis NBRC 106175 TaxID=1353532 RepID=A0ABR4TS50_9PROT|nr:hypothetical protein SMB34_13445 [Thalassospira permensis NBRC 106175]
MVPAHLVAGDYDEKKPAHNCLGMFRRNTKAQYRPPKKKTGVYRPGLW